MNMKREVPLEEAAWFDRVAAEESARKTDRASKPVGAMWNIQFLDNRDFVHYFATVLKIDTDNYRFFSDFREAEAHRVMRGLPDCKSKILRLDPSMARMMKL